MVLCSIPMVRKRRTVHMSLYKRRAMLLLSHNGKILAQRSPDEPLFLNYSPNLRPGCRVLYDCLNIGDGNVQSALLVCGTRRAAIVSIPVKLRTHELALPALRFFHDEKVPIQRIIDSVGLIRSAAEGAPPQEAATVELAIDSILTSCQRLLDSINSLAEGASNLAMPRPRDIDLVEFVRDVCADASSDARNRDISLRFLSNENTLPATVDPDMIERIVQNLLSNAFKYTPRGSRVRVEVNRLTAQRAQLVVQDNGAGIPREIQSRVFERFVRAEGVESTGSGLGLNNVKTMAAMHGGSVYCQSAPGTGTRIEVLLPLRPLGRGDRRRRRSDVLPGQTELPLL